MTIELKVNKSYMRRDGRREDIVKDDANIFWPFLSKNNYHYKSNGRHSAVVCDADLIAEWPTEPTQPVKTLRDDFAMAALTGLFSAQTERLATGRRLDDDEIVYYAAEAYRISEEMMKAREETK